MLFLRLGMSRKKMELKLEKLNLAETLHFNDFFKAIFLIQY